ncbi:hypothetical protein SERLA73DRAFT_184743, partial [Serpula lacrymans var. lacrymans S7.3]
MEDLQLAIDFANVLKDAQLDDQTMPIHPETLQCLRNPPEYPCVLDDPHERFSLDLLLATTSALEEVYDKIHKAYARLHPEDADKILSHYYMKCRMVELTGVNSLVHDTCIDSCIACTGPFVQLQKRPTCNAPHYDQQIFDETGGKEKRARQQFHTMPIGPQTQALWHDSSSAEKMKYRETTWQNST